MAAAPAGAAAQYISEPVEKRDTLQEARITADKLAMKHNSTQTGLIKLDSRKINPGFAVFGAPDLIKTLQTLPGVATGTELLSGMYVHGGDGSDNLFLLDGVPLYQVTHLAGLLSSFNIDMIEDLDFYKSGFPARYGGRLSSVVDIRTKEGDYEEYHGNLSIGLLDGHAQVEGPLFKGRTSFNVGLRRTWVDAVSVPVLAYVNVKEASIAKQNGYDPESYDGHYEMRDFNVKLTHKFSETNRLTFNFYNGRDGLRIGYTEPSRYRRYENGERYIYDENWNIIGENRIIEEHKGEDNIGGKVVWGNLTGSLNWKNELSDALSSDISLYYTQSRARILVSMDEWAWEGDDSRTLMEDENMSKINDLGINADFLWTPHKSHSIRFGGNAQNHAYFPTRSDTFRYTIGKKAILDTTNTQGLTFSGIEASLYAEDEMELTDMLKANIGVRYSLYSSPGKVYHSVEPRAAFKFQMNDNVSFKASYAEMSQFSHLVSCTYIDLPTNCWMPSTAKVAPMKSRQVAGGIYTFITPEVKLNVEGWYKTMDHLLEYSGTNLIFPALTAWEKDFSEGKGKSYGAEVELTYDTEKTSLAAYYTLSWSLRKFDDFFTGWYKDRNDNRHKLTLMGTYRFSGKFEAYASWNYHTGSWATFPTHIAYEGNSNYGNEVYNEPYNTKLPDYHRLDLGLNFRKTTRRGNLRTWNLSIYNVYCRMNPIMGHLDWDDKGNYFGTYVGIVPIIPTFSYAIKF